MGEGGENEALFGKQAKSMVLFGKPEKYIQETKRRLMFVAIILLTSSLLAMHPFIFIPHFLAFVILSIEFFCRLTIFFSCFCHLKIGSTKNSEVEHLLLAKMTTMKGILKGLRYISQIFGTYLPL